MEKGATAHRNKNFLRNYYLSWKAEMFYNTVLGERSSYPVVCSTLLEE